MFNEGGFKLTNITGDPGRQTYAGISRRYHPNWAGWLYIDVGDLGNPALPGLVKEFYEETFWDRINGDVIWDQTMAESVYDFAVNAGPVIAIKLAQKVLGVAADGIVGPVTSSAINLADAESFSERYALAKMAWYAAICRKNRGQKKFLLGWINRVLKGTPWISGMI